MLRIALCDVITKHHEIRFFSDSNTAQPVIAKQLIGFIYGGRLNHLFYSYTLAHAMQCIRTAGKLAEHSLLHTD